MKEKLKKSMLKFVNVFKDYKEILRQTLIDGVTLGVIAGLFSIFLFVMNSAIQEITKGRSTSELQQLLVTGTFEQVQAFSTNLQTFTVLFVGGTFFLLLLTLFLFSFSRAYLWKTIHQKKFSFKQYWKWNLVILLSIPIAFGLSIGFMAIKTVVLYLITAMFQTITEPVLMAINNVLTFFTLVLTMQWWFAMMMHFTMLYKVWTSVGDAFSFFAKRWRLALERSLYLTVSFTVVNLLITIGLNRLFPFNVVILSISQFVILVVLVAVARVYFHKTTKDVKHGH